jgi:hypothetical protein
LLAATRMTIINEWLASGYFPGSNLFLSKAMIIC